MKNKAETDCSSPERGALFSYLKRNREKLLKCYGDPSAFCRALMEDAANTVPESAQTFLRRAHADERHYVIASAYAVLIGDDRRRELSAYFTPPVLVKAAIEASAPFLEAKKHPAVLDPACGGGSFLTPVARHLVMQKRRKGMPVHEACRATVRDINGIEIDAGLAALSRSLLKDMLASEYRYMSEHQSDVVRCENALTSSPREKYDLVIGNPPYGKIGIKADQSHLEEAGLLPDAIVGGIRAAVPVQACELETNRYLFSITWAGSVTT